MIRIPFTKWSVDFFTILCCCLLVADLWQGNWSGALGIVVGYFMIWGLVFGLLTVLAAPFRRPGEHWRQWADRGRGRLGHDRYQPSQYCYVQLDCGHQAQLSGTERPTPGSVVWCTGHHPVLGPAQPELVMADSPTASSFNGYQLGCKTVSGWVDETTRSYQ